MPNDFCIEIGPRPVAMSKFLSQQKNNFNNERQNIVKVLKLLQVDHFLFWGFFKFIATEEPNNGKKDPEELSLEKFKKKITLELYGG